VAAKTQLTAAEADKNEGGPASNSVGPKLAKKLKTLTLATLKESVHAGSRLGTALLPATALAPAVLPQRATPRPSRPM